MRIRARNFPRVDWNAIKNQIPIEAVVAEYAGPPAKTEGGRLWFHCPMPGHEDRRPSFSVDPASGRWRCWSRCGSGSAADLVMQLEGASFPEAVQRLAARFGRDGGPGIEAPPRPRPAAPKPKPPPPELDSDLRQEGEALIAEAGKRLWGPKGGKALAHLRGRGLADEAIRAARLGAIGPTAVPYKNRPGRYTTRGIAIPWFLDGRLELLKVRRPAGCDPKYHATYWGRPSLYAPFGLRPGFPLILVEGEFDAILLGWELRDHADVATLGSASGEPDRRALRILTNAPRLFIATDGDGGGYRAGRKLAKLFPLAIRVWPAAKDWCDTHKKWPGIIAYAWGRCFPLGDPPRPEDFAPASLYALEPDERDRIEAQAERAAIQAEGEGVEGEPKPIEEGEPIEPIGPSLPSGGFEPEADDEAARLASAIEGEAIEEAKIEPQAVDRIMSAAGFLRVDPSELDAFAEFDPPAVDPPAVSVPKARERPRKPSEPSPSLFDQVPEPEPEKPQAERPMDSVQTLARDLLALTEWSGHQLFRSAAMVSRPRPDSGPDDPLAPWPGRAVPPHRPLPLDEARRWVFADFYPPGTAPF